EPLNMNHPTLWGQSSSAAGQSRRLHFVSGLGRPSGRLFLCRFAARTTKTTYQSGQYLVF
ncbi:hypothetical protein, partial [Klebsiella pneumoniae]|uniref:hypothetical protein n=1 Tax=Klebsiella pneumoniae TaxID=573 RepID=UPI0019D10F37